jgi:hypothetical protein
MDEYQQMYQYEDQIRAMGEDERKAKYESWLQTLDEDERQKIIAEDEAWEKAKPEMQKKMQTNMYLSLYEMTLKNGKAVPPKELAKAVRRRQTDTEVPSVIIDELCKIILGETNNKGGRPKTYLIDPADAERDFAIHQEFNRMRAEGTTAEKCYEWLAENHDLSHERCRNIITKKNNEQKQREKLLDEFMRRLK